MISGTRLWPLQSVCIDFVPNKSCSFLRLDLDHSLAPMTYVTQAMDGLKKRLVRWNGVIPAFGRAVGMVVNYAPDHAVRFDLEGNPVEVLDQAHRLGVAQFCIGKRAVSFGLT